MRSKLMMMIGLGIVVSLATPSPAQFGPTERAEKSASHRVVAIRAGRLFDGKSDQLATNQVVVIRGDRIAEVGPAERVRIPGGAEVVDLS